MTRHKTLYDPRSYFSKFKSKWGGVKLNLPSISETKISNYSAPREGEKHAPLANYCGPGTQIGRRINENIQPTTATDSACQLHDIQYFNIGDAIKNKEITEEEARDLVRQADNQLLQAADKAEFLKNPLNKLHSYLVKLGIKGKKWAEDKGFLNRLQYTGGTVEFNGSGISKHIKELTDDELKFRIESILKKKELPVHKGLFEEDYHKVYGYKRLLDHNWKRTISNLTKQLALEAGERGFKPIDIQDLDDLSGLIKDYVDIEEKYQDEPKEPSPKADVKESPPVSKLVAKYGDTMNKLNQIYTERLKTTPPPPIDTNLIDRTARIPLPPPPPPPPLPGQIANTGINRQISNVTSKLNEIYNDIIEIKSKSAELDDKAIEKISSLIDTKIDNLQQSMDKAFSKNDIEPRPIDVKEIKDFLKLLKEEERALLQDKGIEAKPETINAATQDEMKTEPAKQDIGIQTVNNDIKSLYDKVMLTPSSQLTPFEQDFKAINEMTGTTTMSRIIPQLLKPLIYTLSKDGATKQILMNALERFTNRMRVRIESMPEADRMKRKSKTNMKELYHRLKGIIRPVDYMIKKAKVKKTRKPTTIEPTKSAVTTLSVDKAAPKPAPEIKTKKKCNKKLKIVAFD